MIYEVPTSPNASKLNFVHHLFFKRRSRGGFNLTSNRYLNLRFVKRDFCQVIPFLVQYDQREIGLTRTKLVQGMFDVYPETNYSETSGSWRSTKRAIREPKLYYPKRKSTKEIKNQPLTRPSIFPASKLWSVFEFLRSTFVITATI